VMGGLQPTEDWIRRALESRKSVVTANKQLIARCGPELIALARQMKQQIEFGASVAGGVPVISGLRDGLAGDELFKIRGILNGTCNYILTRMEREKLSFAECLKDAQRLGYAEADPSFDVEGHDTAQKLAILASIAFGTKVNPDAVYVEGISSIEPADLEAADELGYRVKLLGVAVRTDKGIEQRVHPTMVRKDSAIAQVMGVTNAVSVDTDGVAPITLVGPGAGGAATASAVVFDLGDIARGVRAVPFGWPTAGLATSEKAPMQLHEGGYYIRLLAVDRPGTFAAIAKHLADEQISLESIVQRHRGSRPHGGDDPKSPEAPAAVILITYATTEDAVRRALKAIDSHKVIAGVPQLIRIEKD